MCVIAFIEDRGSLPVSSIESASFPMSHANKPRSVNRCNSTHLPFFQEVAWRVDFQVESVEVSVCNWAV